MKTILRMGVEIVVDSEGATPDEIRDHVQGVLMTRVSDCRTENTRVNGSKFTANYSIVSVFPEPIR